MTRTRRICSAARAYQPRSTKTLATAPPPRKLKEWEQQLLELRQQMGGKEDGSAAVEREREIYYEIDAAESRTSGTLVVQTSQRQRRANGQWGKLKPLKLRPGRLGEIEHEDDRRILAYLTGGTPERSSWIAQQTEFQSAVYRYQVPFELCEVDSSADVRDAAARGCSIRRRRPVSRSTGTRANPGRLALVLDQTSNDEQWQLSGELRRGEERLAVSELDLLVPGGLAVYDGTMIPVDDFGAQPWVQLLNTDRPVMRSGRR